MENLKNNVILFYVLGVLSGAGVVILQTEYFGAGIVMLLAVIGTLISLFWYEIKELL